MVTAVRFIGKRASSSGDVRELVGLAESNGSMLSEEIVDPHYIDVLDVRFQRGWVAGSPKGGRNNDPVGIAELTGVGKYPIVEFPLLLQCLSRIQRFGSEWGEFFFFEDDLCNLKGLFCLHCLNNTSGEFQSAGSCAIHAGIYEKQFHYGSFFCWINTRKPL